jgi:hypothetical protein
MTMRLHQITQILAVCGVVGSMAAGGRALAEPATLVYGNVGQIGDSPKSVVPGGLPGFPDARFKNFNNRIFRSPTTNQWELVVTTNATPATADQVMLVGSGLTGTVWAQEGVTEYAPGLPISFASGTRLEFPRINDSGQWAMAFRTAGGVSTGEADQVVRWNGATFDVIAKPNDPVPAQSGVTWFGGFTAASIANNGAVSFLGVVNPGIAATDSAFMNNGNLLVAEVNVSIPTGQSPASGNAQWADIDSGEFYTSADGLHWIALGEVGVNTAADKVVVVDNAVVIQEGSVIAGSSFTSPVSSISTSFGIWMEPNGDWFAKGSNVDGIDWIVKNGAVIVAEGQAVAPGSGLVWETFRTVRGNNRGDYVISGNASGDTLTDDLLVFNGQRVLAHESDPVDLNGNGVFDDTLFLGAIQDHGALTDDGNFVFASRLKNSATATGGFGTDPNNASLVLVRACRADINGSGSVTVQDIFDFLAAYFGNSPTADINLSGAISVQDIFDFLAAYFAGC